MLALPSSSSTQDNPVCKILCSGQSCVQDNPVFRTILCSGKSCCRTILCAGKSCVQSNPVCRTIFCAGQCCVQENELNKYVILVFYWVSCICSKFHSDNRLIIEGKRNYTIYCRLYHLKLTFFCLQKENIFFVKFFHM